MNTELHKISMHWSPFRDVNTGTKNISYYIQQLNQTTLLFVLKEFKLNEKKTVMFCKFSIMLVLISIHDV